jgi:cytochrome P450 family 130
MDPVAPAPFVYDPTRPDFPERAHAVYRRLRDEHPVYHHAGRGFFALSRFEDVRAAANDPARFSSEGTSIGQGLLPMVQQLDPPRHDALRALVTKAFTARRVAEIEPRMREIARELALALRRAGGGDLLRDFAAQLPSRVIGELIGVPPERREAFLEWTEAMIGADPKDAASAERFRDPATQIYGEFAKLLAERRAEPRDDLMSALLAAETDGRRLTEQELLGFCFVLIVAGNDTTANLLANGAVLLARHPEQRALLAREPARLSNAVEEMLRYESPAQALPRRATRTLALHGVEVPEGAEVLLVWGAANHDEREFDEPERFDVARPLRRHLAFGHGLHFCLGAHLARLEARLGFEELLAALPDYRLAREPRWLPSFWARAYEAVPVEG